LRFVGDVVEYGHTLGEAMSDKVEYWVRIAEYDVESARALLNAKRYLHVGFMCHQVVEKMLKAYYVDTKNEIPPRIHNLRRLASLTGIYDEMTNEQRDFVDTLEPLNIEGRYPADNDDVSAALDDTACRDLVAKTEELHEWIEQRLSTT
jgi:HEPN domain-containing protein